MFMMDLKFLLGFKFLEFSLRFRRTVWTFRLSIKITKKAALGITFSFIFTPVIFRYVTAASFSILFTGKFFLAEVKNLFTLV